MATKTWIGGAVGTPHSWTALGNWGTGVLAPVAGDIANITTLGTPSVDVASGTVAATSVNVTNGNQLFIEGTGKLNVAGTIFAGGTTGAANTSTIFVWNSAVLTANNASIGGNLGGAGIIDVDQGGTFNVTNNITVTSVNGGGVGMLQIHNGGIVNAGSVTVGVGPTIGTVVIGGVGVFGEAAGTLSASTVTLNTFTSTLKFHTIDAASFNGIISGAGGVTVNSAGQTTTLTGVNTYSGVTQILGGRVSINNSSGLGSGSIILNASNGELSTTANSTLANSFAMQGANSTIAAANGTTLTLTGTSSFSGLAGTTHFGTATETGKIIFADSSFFINVAETISIDGGVLVAGNAQLRNLMSNSVVQGTNIASGATLDLNGQLGFLIQNLTGAGNVINDGAVATTLSISNTTIQTFSGVISDGTSALAVAIVGNTNEIWTGHNNFTGSTYIGTVNANLKAGVANAFSAASDMQNYGTLDLGGFDQTIGALSGPGMVINTGGVMAALQQNNANVSFFSGTINGQISFEKMGVGPLTFSGINTYTGATIIDQGALVLSVAGSIANSVNVQMHAGTTIYIDNTTSGATIKDLSAVGGVATAILAGKALTISDQAGAIGAMTFIGSGAAADALSITLNASLANFSLATASFTNWGAAADTITLNGNALDNILTGSSSSDIINGGAGSDILIGGVANSSDTLTGGNGNDTFVFNVNEILPYQFDAITDYTRDANGVGDTIAYVGVSSAFVSAGSSGGVTSISYGNGINTNYINLANAGTNQIVIKGYIDLAHALSNNLASGWQYSFDVTNEAAHNWTKILSNFDANTVLDSRNTFYDDGTRIFTDYDNLSNQTWSRTEYGYNAANQLVAKNIYYDNATSLYLTFDPTGLQNWNYKQAAFDTLGRLTNSNTYYDDGTALYLTYDPTDAAHPTGLQNWTYKQAAFDAVGRLTNNNTYYDNSTSLYLTFDPVDAAHPTGLQNWNYKQATFDALNRVTTSNTYYDDGTALYLTFDPVDAAHPTGLQNWNYKQAAFDSSGRLTNNNIYYDNGTSVYYLYDPVDAAHPTGFANWQYEQTNFDNLNNITLHIRHMDDGSNIIL